VLHLFSRLPSKAHNLVLISGHPFHLPVFYLLGHIPAFPELSPVISSFISDFRTFFTRGLGM
jgi:hypothetical protein